MMASSSDPLTGLLPCGTRSSRAFLVYLPPPVALEMPLRVAFLLHSVQTPPSAQVGRLQESPSPAFPLLGLPRLTSHGSSHPSSFQPPAIHQVMRCLVLASTVVASPLWVASVLASPSLCMVWPLLHLPHLLPSSTSSPPSAPSSYLFVLTSTTWRPSWMATSTSRPLLSSSFVHMPPPLTPPSAAPSTTPSPPFFSLSASPAASPLLPLLPLLTALRVLTP